MSNLQYLIPMDQDWHETLLTQNRIPHRLSKSHKSTTFDVRKLFGRHQLTCTAQSSSSKKKSESILEIFRLSDDGRGVLGALHLRGVLSAEVIMSGSRKSLEGVISKIEGNTRSIKEDARDSEEDDDEEDGEEFMREEQPPFEKNSFRNPKFWVRWKSTDNPDDWGTGYLVFSGNYCRRFKGTLSSELREWDNIAILGWKAVGMSERDVPFIWNHSAHTSQNRQ